MDIIRPALFFTVVMMLSPPLVAAGTAVSMNDPGAPAAAVTGSSASPVDADVPHDKEGVRQPVDGGARAGDDRLQQLEAEQQQILRLLKQLQAKVDQDGGAGLPVSAIRVSVVNASGIDRLGNLVANILRKQGYKVVSVVDNRQLAKEASQVFYKGGASQSSEIVHIMERGAEVAKSTLIYCREGFDQVCATLEHALPKDQKVEPRPALDARVDAQVLVGRDMKFLLLQGLKR
ncbi:MAG: LytR C-terminal domain-containing protein [Gammaproteobacteria bacterium]|nr:LytR C-terminal domain-containing protein [Gammaproteobacteria bacterium]